jgi:hypothetical protein
LPQIYSCNGKHFKVYNDDLRQVLEHPSEEEPVTVNFSHSHSDFTIAVTGFVNRRMRLEGQKDRGDIYILQNQFKPLLAYLEDLLENLNVQSDGRDPWKFRSPQARDSRQSVPDLVKLAEVSEVSLIAPFDAWVFCANNGYLVADSEIPGIDQKKWYSEGAERQIHLGVFGRSHELKEERVPEAVIVNIPLRKLKNNFLEPIRANWID